MITSKDNERIKYLRKLKDSKFMKEERKFIIEGNHLVMEALNAGILLETYSLYDNDYHCTNYLVTENVLKSVSEHKSVPDIIGVCKFIDAGDIGDKVLILDNVQDPGNVGTIIRSACAFNFDTVVLGLDSVNKYNDKLIRASQGMLFKMNVVTYDIKSLIIKLKGDNYHVYGTNVVNGINVNEVDKTAKVAIIMGNEGTGISDDVSELVDKNIYIKTSDNCESLNVSVAASIIMYELGGK